MLAQEVTRTYADRAHFVVEDFGASRLAKRFGVDKYPAIFVDDALVARPEDFYDWGGPATGKYVPWKDLANRRKFKADLQRMIDIRLAGGTLRGAAPGGASPQTQSLPSFAMKDLEGRTFTFDELRGEPVIVEFWATWCPICLETLQWMKTSMPAARVVAVAVDSEENEIARVVSSIQPRAKVVVASDELRRAFSGPPAVPTLLIADAGGTIVRTIYGAPPYLHQQIERELRTLKASAAVARK